ncbi:hypothetical protein [Rufibacter tibetensis]|uniref:Uncharacterized protein n=1 Tax=Rufibacter tibetensis TaxID=512763 RepID=A0A0P0CWN7_9BACT|nr:hypothetical protein [Rufibacter tibetensis]ALI99789.1 hypothetical protein DC20_13405 [Rufibacter tibetensis]
MSVKLANTDLELAIPQWNYFMAVSGYPYKDRGILPDYPITYTAEDLIQKRDVDLEFTMDLIKPKKASSTQAK